MRKVICRYFLFFLATQVGFAWSEATFEEKAETFMAFFRVATEFVTQCPMGCPNKFTDFHRLFKNLHEQLDKILGDTQEHFATGNSVPPPPPPPAPSPPLSVLKTKGLKDDLYAKAKTFVDNGGLLEKFGGRQVNVFMYEQFAALKKSWQPEAQKTYNVLISNCFCRFFDNCRLLLSAFLNELCCKFPRETQNLASEIKAVLKDPKYNQTESIYWRKPLEAFEILFNEGQFEKQLETFLKEMFLYSFENLSSLKESLVFISLKAETIASITEDLEDWAFGLDPKSKMNIALKMWFLPEEGRCWVELSEMITSLQGMPKANERKVRQLLESVPECKYREVVHEKLYRFLEEKYKSNRAWRLRETDVALFKEVVRWSNTLPPIPWDEVMMDGSLRENLEHQFTTEKAKDKFKAISKLASAKEEYRRTLDAMKEVLGESLSVSEEKDVTRLNDLINTPEDATFIKKMQDRLEEFSNQVEEALGGSIKALVNAWRKPDYTNALVILRNFPKEEELRGKIKGGIEEESSCRILIKIVNILYAEIGCFTAEINYKSKAKDIVTPPDYKEKLLSSVLSDSRDVDLLFRDGLENIQQEVANVHVRDPLPFLERAKSSLNRPMSLKRLFLGTPSPAKRKTRSVSPTRPIRRLIFEQEVEEEQVEQPEETSADAGELASQLEELRGKLATSEKQRKFLDNQLERLQKQLDEIKMLNHKLEEEIAQLKAEIERLKREKEELEKKTNALNIEKDALKLSRDEASAKNSALINENKFLKAENEKLKSQVSLLEKRPEIKTVFRGGGSTVIRTNDEAELALRDELAQKEANLGAKDREISQKDDEIQSLQDTVAELRQKLQEADAKMHSSKQHSLDAFGAETSDLDVRYQELAMMRQEIIEQKDAQDKLQAELENRVKNLDNREKAVKAKEDRLSMVSSKDHFGNTLKEILSNNIQIGGKNSNAKKFTVSDKISTKKESSVPESGADTSVAKKSLQSVANGENMVERKVKRLSKTESPQKPRSNRWRNQLSQNSVPVSSR